MTIYNTYDLIWVSNDKVKIPLRNYIFLDAFEKWAEDVIWSEFNLTDHRLEDMLPKAAGVYFFTVTDINTGDKDIVYIGASSNILNRLKNHEILRFIKNRLLENYVITISYGTVKDNHFVERQLIWNIQPLFNSFFKIKRNKDS